MIFAVAQNLSSIVQWRIQGRGPRGPPTPPPPPLFLSGIILVVAQNLSGIVWFWTQPKWLISFWLSPSCAHFAHCYRFVVELTSFFLAFSLPASSQRSWLSSQKAQQRSKKPRISYSKKDTSAVGWVLCYTHRLAGEDSWHFATPSLVSPRNDVWETSAEIPHWWRVTTQIWLVLLIGWGNCTSGHRTTRSGWWHFISVEFLRLILRRHFAREPVLGVPKCQLFCSGYMKTNVEILRSYWHHNLWFFFFCTSPYEVDYGYELWDFRAL